MEESWAGHTLIQEQNQQATRKPTTPTDTKQRPERSDSKPPEQTPEGLPEAMTERGQPSRGVNVLNVIGKERLTEQRAGGQETAIYLRMQIGRSTVEVLADTGATRSFLSRRMFEEISTRHQAQLRKELPFGAPTLADGQVVEVLGIATFPVTISKVTVLVKFQVVAQLFPTAILGLTDMHLFGMVLDTRNFSVWVGPEHDREKIVACRANQDDMLAVSLDGEICMPGTTTLVWTRVWAPTGSTVIITSDTLDERWSVPAVLGTVEMVKGVPCVLVPLLNGVHDEELIIEPGQAIAHVEPVDQWQQEAIAVLTEGVTTPVTRKPVITPEEIRTQLMKTQGLSESQREQAFQRIAEFSDVFAEKATDLGSTSLVKHIIDTGDAPPTHVPARRAKPALVEQEAKLFEDIRASHKISPSSSPWSSPVVIVPKRQGGFRFAIDYRALNAITKKDVYPLPRIDDDLAVLCSARWFSTLDLASGYWQVELDEASKAKTAFAMASQGGALWQWEVMPFGLCNAPASFQRLMDLVLAGVKWTHALCYIDDILIFSPTFDKHLDDLADVLTRLRSANLRARLSKCSFAAQQVSYLGHRVDSVGVSLDPRHVEAMRTFPVPHGAKCLHQFLGLASFFRRFMCGFAKIVRPLQRLLQKGAKFEWTPDDQRIFEDIREKLTSAPVLTHPDFKRPFILYTDGSAQGLGAALTQQDAAGAEHVVAYASRQTRGTEGKLSTSHLEALAATWAVETFAPFLSGVHFTLVTDHAALKWLLEQNIEKLPGRIARWVLRLLPFDFTVVHRAGKTNTVADALSRMAPPFSRAPQRGQLVHKPEPEEEEEKLNRICTIGLAGPERAPSREDLIQAQSEEPFYNEVMAHLQGRTKIQNPLLECFHGATCCAAPSCSSPLSLIKMALSAMKRRFILF
jgi:hypothetical protein